MSQVGVTLPFDGLPLHQHREAIERLADAGISEVSTGEANGLDGLSPLLLAAAWRPGLTLTAAVVSAFTRGPSIMASTAAALAEAAPGRARFGIGAGSDRIVEGWNGIPFTKPYSRVRTRCGCCARRWPASGHPPSRSPRPRWASRISSWAAHRSSHRRWWWPRWALGCSGWPPPRPTGWC